VLVESIKAGDFDKVLCIDKYDLFDRINKKALQEAHKICCVCPCIKECKSYAETQNHKEGVWAGDFYYLNKKKDLFIDNDKTISLYPFKRVKIVILKKN
jgi:hypothetical protein